MLIYFTQSSFKPTVHATGVFPNIPLQGQSSPPVMVQNPHDLQFVTHNQDLSQSKEPDACQL